MLNLLIDSVLSHQENRAIQKLTKHIKSLQQSWSRRFIKAGFRVEDADIFNIPGILASIFHEINQFLFSSGAEKRRGPIASPVEAYLKPQGVAQFIQGLDCGDDLPFGFIHVQGWITKIIPK